MSSYGWYENFIQRSHNYNLYIYAPPHFDYFLYLLWIPGQISHQLCSHKSSWMGLSKKHTYINPRPTKTTGQPRFVEIKDNHSMKVRVIIRRMKKVTGTKRCDTQNGAKQSWMIPSLYQIIIYLISFVVIYIVHLLCISSFMSSQITSKKESKFVIEFFSILNKMNHFGKCPW